VKKSIGMRVQRREDSGVGRVEVRPRDWVERRGREAPGLGERGAPRLGEMTCRRGCRASSPKLPSAPPQRRKEWAAPVVRNPVRWRVRTWSPTGSPPMAAGGAGSGRAGCCRGGTIAGEAGRHGRGRRPAHHRRIAGGCTGRRIVDGVTMYCDASCGRGGGEKPMARKKNRMEKVGSDGLGRVRWVASSMEGLIPYPEHPIDLLYIDIADNGVCFYRSTKEILPRTCLAVGRVEGSGSSILLTRSLALAETLGHGSRPD